MQINQPPPLANKISNALPLKKTNHSADMKKEAELKKACQNFEAIIVQQMLTAMRKSIPKSGLLDSGFSQDMYQSMYDESLAQEVTSNHGMGLADALFSQLSTSIEKNETKKVTIQLLPK